MKKIFLLLAVLLCSLALPTAAKADVDVNSTNFPDPNFLAYVKTLTGASDGILTDTELGKITKIDCSSKNIADLTGIKYFTALEILGCVSNQLTSLDVSYNKELEQMNCSKNKILSLDLTNNKKLFQLICNGNGMTNLNISSCSLMTYIDCISNQLSSIDLSNMSELKTVYCYGNNLVSLNVSNNPKLDFLSCGVNKLTTIDVSKNTLLTQLHIDGCNIAAVDLTNNPKLHIFRGTENGRKIKVYSYDRHNDGTIDGYYVPLVAQTTGEHPTSDLATLIDDAGQTGDPTFDLTKVDQTSWKGATISKINGINVLLLDASVKKVTYNYNTNFPGTSSWAWITDNNAKLPYNNFYFTWDPSDTSQVVTGVDGVESNDVSVYTVNGAINIGGSFDGNVNVYNLRGQQVYCGTDSEIAVPAGMYIVKVNGKAHKVLVK